ncbi:hypothetical protein LOD99_7247 [Oopsacas minuta]|uniref:GIY-YIG domain-containing protein n=1 Tax=Oopsacas minuta TaxID=111878 RepID=A0AAV7JU66_9METZ|nr:hypothetical protein LOD99_7247 [Oopsacas minuta]
MSEPASQDLAYSPLTKAKHQFLNAKLAFEQSIRAQESVFDEAKGIPEFLSDSFGVSRILLLFPRGTPFLDELIKSNRTRVYTQLTKTVDKSGQRTIFGIGFNRSGRKSSEPAQDPFEKELDISIRVHYYNEANIVTIVEHSTNLVVDCGVFPPDMSAEIFWPYLFRRSVEMVPKLKYTTVIIDNSTFINCIDLTEVYGEVAKKSADILPQALSNDSDSDDELENQIRCSKCRAVHHRVNPSYRRCVWCRFTVDTCLEGVRKVHILMELLELLGSINVGEKAKCVLADLLVCVINQHKVRHFALLSLRSKPGVIYETLRNLKEDLYSLLYFLIKKDQKELQQIIPIGMERTFYTEFDTIGIPKGKVERYKITADVFESLKTIWEKFFTADNLEKILYYEATCEICFFPQNVGTIPCKKKECKNCDMMIEKKHFTSTQRRKIYEVSDAIDCNTRSLIYILTCTICRKQYVGSSSKELQARLEDHRSMARHGRGTSADVHAFYEHTKNRENIPKDKRCKIEKSKGAISAKDDPMKIFELIGIEIVKPHKLGERESHWIRELETCVPHGLNEFY